MSSVGNSDSADRADKNQLRRTRDEFRQRESDLIKRHNIDARRTAEQNQDEITSLKEKHSAAMDEARVHARDSITRRDHRYQREIEDIRNMHRRQLQTSADETSRRESGLRKALSGDAGVAARHAEDRFEKLAADYEQKSSAEAEAYARLAQEGREAQGKSIDAVRDKLSREHEKETEHLRHTLGEKIAEVEGEYTKYRREVAGQQRDAQVRNVQLGQDQSQKLTEAVRTEREERARNEADLREDYDRNLAAERERFGRALAERDEKSEASAVSFRAKSEDRALGTINALKRENQTTRAEAARELAKVKHQAGKELIGARENFQKNVDAYRRERDEAYGQGNAERRAEINDMRENLERDLRGQARELRERMTDQSRDFRREFDGQREEFEGRLSAKDQLSDQRVAHVTSRLNDDKNRLAQLNQDTIEATQRSKQREMKELRGALEDDKRGEVGSMRNLMRKQELRHAERMGAVVSKYDKQVQALKDELIRERKLSGENNKRAIDELRRAHQLELDQIETKTRSRLNEINQRHDQDARAQSKRYEEKLDQILNETKKS